MAAAHSPRMNASETYQLDSDDYDSDADDNSIPDDEYAALVDEGEFGD